MEWFKHAVKLCRFANWTFLKQHDIEPLFWDDHITVHSEVW